MDGSRHCETNCPERSYGEKKKLEKNSIWETEVLISVASVSTCIFSPCPPFSPAQAFCRPSISYLDAVTAS